MCVLITVDDISWWPRGEFRRAFKALRAARKAGTLQGFGVIPEGIDPSRWAYGFMGWTLD